MRRGFIYPLIVLLALALAALACGGSPTTPVQREATVEADTPTTAPTVTPILSPTPLIVKPTSTPRPTAAPGESPAAPARVVIFKVDKEAEYVDISNVGGSAQDLTGWVLVSERGDQRCPLSGTLDAGDTLRIWARIDDADRGGLNCRFPGNIWNNDDPDAAVLLDAAGHEVDRK